MTTTPAPTNLVVIRLSLRVLDHIGPRLRRKLITAQVLTAARFRSKVDLEVNTELGSSPGDHPSIRMWSTESL